MDTIELRNEIDRYIEYMYNGRFVKGSEEYIMLDKCARHFYDIGCRRAAEKYDEIEYNRQRAEESVPKDLPLPEDTVLFNKGVAEGRRLMMEELSEHIAAAYQLGLATHNPNIEPKVELNLTTDTTPVDGKELLYVSDKSYKIGWRDCKEQMMKEAVEGEVIKTDKHTSVRYKSYYGTDRYFYGIANQQFKSGDKVRIIIVKEDEK